jgi:two-component system sensor histidine kinase MprB
MSLRSRLALVVALVTLVVFGGLSVVSYAVVAQSMRREVDTFLDTRITVLSDQVREARTQIPFGRRVRNPLGEALLQARFDVSSQVIDPAGNVVFAIGDVDLPIDDIDIRIARQESPRAFRDVVIDGVHHRMLVVPLVGGGALQLARGIAEIGSVLDDVRNASLLISFIGVPLSFAAAWLLSQRSTRRLGRLTATTKDIAATGRFDTNIDATGPREVASLATSFNTLLSAVRMAFDRERRFVQDASHELRTPLTSLRANSELLSRDGLDDAARREVLSDIRREVDELTRLSEELASLASDQRGTEMPEPTNLAELVADIVGRATARSGRVIIFTATNGSVPGTTTVLVRRSQAERAVSNLLDNAVKFSPATTSIDVVVDGATLKVIDHGPGVAPGDVVHIFDRFWRSDATRSFPGSGLGLAIVKQFVDDHDGTIVVETTPGGGATFVVRLQPTTAHAAP